MNKILAFDPSKECTGYALIEDGPGDGVLKLVGDIQHTEKEKGQVGSWFPKLMREVGEVITRHTPDVVAVELPAASRKPWGGYKGRSALSMPVYGMAVGGVLSGVYAKFAFDPILVPVDVWAAHIAKGNEQKIGRVRAAAYAFQVDECAFGPKSIAGNMADAALLARWVLLNKVRRAVA
jgi:Holliday junction resolvasome RuvABC endonuclease subunit